MIKAKEVLIHSINLACYAGAGFYVSHKLRCSRWKMIAAFEVTYLSKKLLRVVIHRLFKEPTLNQSRQLSDDESKFVRSVRKFHIRKRCIVKPAISGLSFILNQFVNDHTILKIEKSSKIGKIFSGFALGINLLNFKCSIISKIAVAGLLGYSIGDMTSENAFKTSIAFSVAYIAFHYFNLLSRQIFKKPEVNSVSQEGIKNEIYYQYARDFRSCKMKRECANWLVTQGLKSALTMFVIKSLAVSPTQSKEIHDTLSKINFLMTAYNYVLNHPEIVYKETSRLVNWFLLRF